MDEGNKTMAPKEYISRHGETLDDWVTAASEGRLMIHPHSAMSRDFVLEMALDELKAAKDSRQDPLFRYVDDQRFEIPSGPYTYETADLIIHKIKEAFAEPVTRDMRVARVMIFELNPNDKGELSESENWFLNILADKLRRDDFAKGSLEFASPRDGNTVLFPVLDLRVDIFDRQAIRRVQRNLGAGFQREKDVLNPIVFDVRTFEPCHLLEMMKKVFPDEADTLESNEDFLNLISEHEGDADLALKMRTYKRDGTLNIMREAIGLEPIDEDFSSVYKLAVAQDFSPSLESSSGSLGKPSIER